MNIEAYYKISYGLYVVSTVYEEKLNGYISNSVFQVTADPAQFAIACNKDNYTAEMIKQSNVFAFSALSRETRPDIFGTFGFRSGRTIEKFTKYNYKIGKTGVPILLDDTLAWFECNVVQTLDVGTHILFIGQVIDGDLIDGTSEPMTYAWYQQVKKGKSPKNAPTYIDPEKLKQHHEVIAMDKYYCSACGHIYDPVLGEPDSGIPPGIPFENLPDNWVCPVCGAEKADFVKIV